MNSIVKQEFDILHETEAIRNDLMDMLSDADLQQKLPAANPTLGELCVESGQVQQSYTDSIRTFKQNWGYKPVEAGMAQSVDRLKAWYAELDSDMDAAFSALSEDDVQSRTIDRGFPAPVRTQLHIYREALLIFYAKAVVYLHALDKPLPQKMAEWIG